MDHGRKDLPRDELWLTQSPASNVTGQDTESLLLGLVWLWLVYNPSSLSLYLHSRVEKLIIKLTKLRVLFNYHIVGTSF